MFSALDSSNNLIDIDTAVKHRSIKYFCPSCHEELVIRRGDVRINHFAHKSNSNCDNYDNDMSEWHRNWQNRFPIKNREVVLKMDCINHDSYGEWSKRATRRTDALCYGYAIEFQNSPITSKEFNERNWFYNSLGKKVVWVFNMIEEFKSGKIKYYEEWYNRRDNGGKYSWNYASKTLASYKSNDKDIIIIFQFAEVCKDEKEVEQSYFERVTWAINSSDDCKDTEFKRFYTSYYPANFIELMEKLKRKEL